HLRCATLSYNERNLRSFASWIENGTVKRLSLLCSKFFVRHNPDLYEQARLMLPAPHALANSRNHAKLICLDLPSGCKMVGESSGNLRANSNKENLTLFNCEALHNFHAQYIDGEIASHAHSQ